VKVERLTDDEERRAVLLSLQALMGSIGSANDAEDHGYLGEAERMRTESCEAVRDLMAQHAFLAGSFPKLQWELDSGHILGFGWAEVGREAGALLEASASPEAPGSGIPRAQCSVCSGLADREYAFQKYGSEESNTYLPAAVERLEVVRDFRPLSSRKRQIRRCPECGAYYLYETDYEYLIGTEDEQTLTRLTDAQAPEYLGESSVEALWAAFMAARPDLVGPDTTYESWCFSDNEADANELAALVLAGRKRATTGDLWSYEVEHEELPQVGDLNVITDWAGNAVCVIRTTGVEILPFDAVTEEFAATEGEGDGSLEYWRRVHQEVFSRRLPDIGKVFEPDMPVVCECFEVVYCGEGAKIEGLAGR